MSNEPAPSVRLTRHFSFPPGKVWQAWTDPQLMKRWFGSDPLGTGDAATGDLRVGGAFEVTFSNSDGTRHTCFGTYRTVDLHKRLVFTWSWKDRQDYEELVTVELEPEAGGTLMRFEHSNIDPMTSHNYEIGWRSTFKKLERVLGQEQAP